MFLKLIIVLILSVSFLYSQQNTFGNDNNKKESKEEKSAVEHKTEVPITIVDEVLYGEEIDQSQGTLQVKDVITNVEKYKGTNIVVEGIISESCRSGGCWVVLQDGEYEIRALTQHKFVLPLDQPVGVKAIVQGKFDVKEITEDQAKHYAEESGDMKKAEEIKGPQIMYRIKATGIKILNQ